MAEENSGDSTTEKVCQTPNKASDDETRNFRKIVFANAPKIRRKSHNKRSVRRTCEELVANFYPETEVSYEAMKLKLMCQFERCSRQTILAYLGRPETRQKETVDHLVQYAKSGTTTNKTHTFIHKLPERKGYVEIFGLASLQKDNRTGKTVFRLYHTRQTELNEEFASPLINPPHESSALKEGSSEVSEEVKDALAYAKRQVSEKSTMKNFLSFNSVPVGAAKSTDEQPVLRRDERETEIERELLSERKNLRSVKVFADSTIVNNKKSESKLGEEEKRLFRALDSSCREGSP